MRLVDLSDKLLWEVCDSLLTERDVIEGFFEAFGFPRDILKHFRLHELQLYLRKQPRIILFGILKEHSVTPVQLLRDVYSSLCDDDVVLELLDDALRSYKPGSSLHLVRPLEEIRRIYNKRIQRKPITYLQRGAILIIDNVQFPAGNGIKSFFMDLDPTSEVTTLGVQADGLEMDFYRTLESWQENQGQRLN